jgi:hypothetical protein
MARADWAAADAALPAASRAPDATPITSANGHGRGALGVSAAPTQPVWPRAGSPGGGPGRASALRELAEDVAEIVREQAIRHGIDVP